MASKSSKAEERGRSDQEQGEEQEAKHPRRFSLTAIFVVAGVLLMEAGTVLLVMWLSRGPAEASGAPTIQPDGSVVLPEDVEELIVEGKATNTKRGVTYVYRFKVHAVVAKPDLSDVKSIMSRRKATIEDAVRRVVARLEPRNLDEEPDLATLRRVLMREFEQIFGPGKIRQLLVPEWTRFRADY